MIYIYKDNNFDPAALRVKFLKNLQAFSVETLLS